MLYTCNKAEACTLAVLLPLLTADDALLLIEDGVYAALDTAHARELLALLPATVARHVLAEDLAARGISDRIQPVFSSVDYAGFVVLSLAHAKVVNWN